MSELWEKIIFGFMGAVTAVMVGLAVYTDYEKQALRFPASQSNTRPDDEKPESLYFYYFDWKLFFCVNTCSYVSIFLNMVFV